VGRQWGGVGEKRGREVDLDFESIEVLLLGNALVIDSIRSSVEIEREAEHERIEPL